MQILDKICHNLHLKAYKAIDKDNIRTNLLLSVFSTGNYYTLLMKEQSSE